MPTSPQDLELEKYFTDVETLRGWFAQAIVAPTLPKRLLVIWGVGGIGKSSVLRMFRLNAKTAHVPVGLASGDDAKSVVDVLTRWAEDLKSDGVTLTTFSKTLVHYREIQAKVENKTKDAREKVTDAAGKAASKTAEAVGGAALGAVLGSVIPGIGTAAGAALGGVVGGMGADALVDYLRGFLTKPDIDLLLDPSKKLTDDFLNDINQVTAKQCIVLMLDTYEQMTALDEWTREFAQRLNENVLLVIAGRAMVDWGREWSSWLSHAYVEELKPMTKRVMQESIRRYYKSVGGIGEPDPKQVNAIIEFSGGLPIVLITAVQLWVKYKVQDFGAVKGEVVHEVVERIREGVPAELYPLLETAAALRYFNKDILRTVSGMGDINTGYEELRRFPFVRSRAEGYALHDRVRELIEENVRIDDPAKFRDVHERAAAYFEALMTNAAGEKLERLGLERLYHRVCVDEERGIELFQRMAEHLVRLRFLNQLRSVLNDTITFQLKNSNSKLWIEYYDARLAHLEFRWKDAESIYRKIISSKVAERKLQAYAMCDLGLILTRREFLWQYGDTDAVKVLEAALQHYQTIDTKIASAWITLSDIYRTKADWANAIIYSDQAVNFFSKQNDYVALLETLSNRIGIFGRQGNLRGVLDTQHQVEKIIKGESLPPYLMRKYQFSFDATYWTGRWSEWEIGVREGLVDAQQSADFQRVRWLTKDLAFSLAMQSKCDEAFQLIEESISSAQSLPIADEIETAWTLSLLGTSLLRCGDLERAESILLESLRILKKNQNFVPLDFTPRFLGTLYEQEIQLDKAENYYDISVKNTQVIKRANHQAGSLTGLTRVHHAQQNYAAISPLLTEAEQLAQQYEYNDHLASLRLTQGHLASDGKTFEVFGDVIIAETIEGLPDALHYYQHALIYALRFNRFLLDEVLAGRPQGTPLRPIIPECLKRGEEGRKMLIALRDWWQTGVNDIGTPRPDTISPISENIPLLEAEKIAREREPGDGSPQRSVLEQIESALKMNPIG